MINAKVYTTPTCPECKELIRLLEATDGVMVQKINMHDPDQRTAAICDDGMMEQSVPVLRLNDGPFINRRMLVEEGKGLKIQGIQTLLEKIKQQNST